MRKKNPSAVSRLLLYAASCGRRRSTLAEVPSFFFEQVLSFHLGVEAGGVTFSGFGGNSWGCPVATQWHGSGPAICLSSAFTLVRLDSTAQSA